MTYVPGSGQVYSAGETQAMISEFQSQLTNAESTVKQLQESALFIQLAVGNGKALDGMTYTQGAALFDGKIKPALTQAGSAFAEIRSDLNTLIAANAMVAGYGYINEYQVKALIDQYTQLRDEQRKLAQQYRDAAASNPSGAAWDLTLASECDAQADKYQTKINNLQTELNALYAFDAAVSGLFTGSQMDLNAVVSNVASLSKTVTRIRGQQKGFKQLTAAQKIAEKVKQVVNDKRYNSAAQKFLSGKLEKALAGKPQSQWSQIINQTKAQYTVDKSGNLLQTRYSQKTMTGQIDGVPQSATISVPQIFVNGKLNEKLTEAYVQDQINKQMNSDKAQDSGLWGSIQQGVGQLSKSLADNAAQILTGDAMIAMGFMLGGADGVGTFFSGGTLAMTGVSEGAATVSGGLVVGGVAVTADGLAKTVGGLQVSFAKGTGGQKQNVGKTSQSFGQQVQGRVDSSTKNFRVDAEPDANKIQIQSGTGKGSIDIRIAPEKITSDNSSITDQIKEDPNHAKFDDSTMETLVKNVRKAANYLKEMGK